MIALPAPDLPPAPHPPLQAFTDHYYTTFDTNRQGLGVLYQEQSMLTFEGQQFLGTQQVRRGLAVGWRRHPPATVYVWG